MVWVHGGALRTGESDDYNPAGLVRRGVVVVTINYRIGALGFLADAALASRPGGPAGNYGLMDSRPRCAGCTATSVVSAATRAT
jgi:para-nitrobenzyl esterase